MFEFRCDGSTGQLEGLTEYGLRVLLELSPRDGASSYDLCVTFAEREPLRYKLLRNDIEFLGNKIQLKRPYLRVVVDRTTAEKFHSFIKKP